MKSSQCVNTLHSVVTSSTRRTDMNNKSLLRVLMASPTVHVFFSNIQIGSRRLASAHAHNPPRQKRAAARQSYTQVYICFVYSPPEGRLQSTPRPRSLKLRHQTPAETGKVTSRTRRRPLAFSPTFRPLFCCAGFQ